MNVADSANEELPEHLLRPMSLEGDMQAPLIDSFPLIAFWVRSMRIEWTF